MLPTYAVNCRLLPIYTRHKGREITLLYFYFFCVLVSYHFISACEIHGIVLSCYFRVDMLIHFLISNSMLKQNV